MYFNKTASMYATVVTLHLSSAPPTPPSSPLQPLHTHTHTHTPPPSTSPQHSIHLHFDPLFRLAYWHVYTAKLLSTKNRRKSLDTTPELELVLWLFACVKWSDVQHFLSDALKFKSINQTVSYYV